MPIVSHQNAHLRLKLSIGEWVLYMQQSYLRFWKCFLMNCKSVSNSMNIIQKVLLILKVRKLQALKTITPRSKHSILFYMITGKTFKNRPKKKIFLLYSISLVLSTCRLHSIISVTKEGISLLPKKLQVNF